MPSCRGKSHGCRRGESHALQGRFPRKPVPEANPTRLQGSIPRAPGAIPTKQALQRQIPHCRKEKPQVRWGVRFSAPWDLSLQPLLATSEADPTASRGESHALQGRFPRLAGSRGQSHAGRTAPEANPTRSRGISHGGRLQRQIPRTPEAIPTHSRGQSHKAGTLEANPTWPKRETAGQMGCQICGTVGFVSDVVHP